MKVVTSKIDVILIQNEDQPNNNDQGSPLHKPIYLKNMLNHNNVNYHYVMFGIIDIFKADEKQSQARNDDLLESLNKIIQ